MFKIRKIVIPLATAMLVACAGNHGRPVTVLPNGEPPYNNAAIEASYYTKQMAVLQADSLKAVETTDWLKFRKEFLKCRLSQPSRFNVMSYEADMSKARNSGDMDKNLNAARKILNIDFTNISAHYAVANHPSTDEKTKEFHTEVIKGLLNSIRDSGKGTSAETAMYVINIAEEYDYIFFSGLRPISQALIYENNQQIDVMGAVDEEGNQYQMYFNVTDFFGHY